ncbi:MAG: ATP-binding cassette domain-containing protein [Myxococcota bacterium]
MQPAGERGSSGAELLSLRGISKRFGAIRALDGVDLSVAAGEVVGLMGDNGAGKSTLLKIIAGNFRPSEGELWLDGERVELARPSEARERGVEVVYQDLALCDNLSAAANVFLGRELSRKVLGFLPVLDSDAMVERAGALFKELGSDTRPRDLVRSMSGGQRQAVAIARACLTRASLTRARILLMDEPTAAIAVGQVQEVLSLIRRLAEQGIALILVSHRMPDIFAVCQRVVVLRRGRKVADRPIQETSPEEVTGLITGAIARA